MILTKYFKTMTLEQTWDLARNGDYSYFEEQGMPAEQIKALKEVCCLKTNAGTALDFLELEDSLTRNIYGDGTVENGESVYAFPFVEGKVIPDNIKEVRGPIGTQTSKWHQETLVQHALLVTANLYNTGKFSRSEATTLGIMHDIGKKYTAATNKRGEVCFYGHAIVGAFIFAKMFDYLDPMIAKPLFAIIYSHMFPKVEWTETEDWYTKQPVDNRAKSRRELLKFFDGNEKVVDAMMEKIDLFAKCDQGVTKFDSDIEARIKYGYSIVHDSL